MLTSFDFIKQTEHAVRPLFKAVEYYHHFLKDTINTTHAFSANNETEAKQKIDCHIRETKDERDEKKKIRDRYYENYNSKCIICGSIVQYAHTFISMFSQNKTYHPILNGIKNNAKIAQFCIGREVEGIPIGLIIYAGRNQHAHMEDEFYHTVVTKIFDHLATFNGVKMPYFNLEEKKLLNYSANILSTLGWDDYETFHKDLIELQRLLD